MASPLSPPRAKALAARIVKAHAGQAPRRLRPLSGGLTNHVFAVRVAGKDLVLRLNEDPAKLDDFLKEHWAMEQAHAAGVPTPRMLEVRNCDEGPSYTIAEGVHGVSADSHPARCDVLRQLGACAARLHTVRADGFGRAFQHKRWADCVADELKAQERLRLLARHGMLDEPVLQALLERARHMARWRNPAVLHHGDLRLKNAIVEPATARLLAVIDWENCVASPAPYWDLSIALHDIGVDEKEAFLEGYGLTPARFSHAAPFVTLFNVLNYAPVVERALAARDRHRIAWLRLRLQGAFDLHSP